MSLEQYAADLAKDEDTLEAVEQAIYDAVYMPTADDVSIKLTVGQWDAALFLIRRGISTLPKLSI